MKHRATNLAYPRRSTWSESTSSQIASGSMITAHTPAQRASNITSLSVGIALTIRFFAINSSARRDPEQGRQEDANNPAMAQRRVRDGGNQLFAGPAICAEGEARAGGSSVVRRGPLRLSPPPPEWIHSRASRSGRRAMYLSRGQAQSPRHRSRQSGSCNIRAT